METLLHMTAKRHSKSNVRTHLDLSCKLDESDKSNNSMQLGQNQLCVQLDTKYMFPVFQIPPNLTSYLPMPVSAHARVFIAEQVSN